jgi:pimeloyl-ACP methyl ester carboxylesterase
MPFSDDIYYHLYEGSSPGKMPPLVLIHGAAGNHLYWPAEIRRIPGIRVYALDLPGHGKSGGRGRQSVASYSKAVQEWLGAIGVHSAVIAGHSMGSAIALTLALEKPEHVSGLILLGAGARLRVSSEILGLAESETTYLSAVKVVVDWSFSASAPVRLKELAATRMSEARQSVLYGDFRACSEFDVMGRLGEIQQPTLILCGDGDRMTPPRYAQYLVEQIPQAQLKVIPEAGHMLQLEKPRVVADEMQVFMASRHYA